MSAFLADDPTSLGGSAPIPSFVSYHDDLSFFELFTGLEFCDFRALDLKLEPQMSKTREEEASPRARRRPPGVSVPTTLISIEQPTRGSVSATDDDTLLSLKRHAAHFLGVYDSGWRRGIARMRCALLSFLFWSEICGHPGNAHVCGVCGGFASRGGAAWHSLHDPLPSLLHSGLGFESGEVGGPGSPSRDLKWDCASARIKGPFSLLRASPSVISLLLFRLSFLSAFTHLYEESDVSYHHSGVGCGYGRGECAGLSCSGSLPGFPVCGTCAHGQVPVWDAGATACVRRGYPGALLARDPFAEGEAGVLVMMAGAWDAKAEKSFVRLEPEPFVLLNSFSSAD
ncbi:hypothetical protein B0H13DRAFT_2377736 [Mycena leptocephala]|nr:hypothetical protein B0H13DRAFT_2377736 [Mycena leptocephala]